ncbi:MAG TPA: LysM peptidoglycan-binding domain-containing protein [Thermotoga sp.]|nr:LysM peptidoglycan-binding domain-containing protein [Thermotoga sp.]
MARFTIFFIIFFLIFLFASCTEDSETKELISELQIQIKNLEERLDNVEKLLQRKAEFENIKEITSKMEEIKNDIVNLEHLLEEKTKNVVTIDQITELKKRISKLELEGEGYKTLLKIIGDYEGFEKRLKMVEEKVNLIIELSQEKEEKTVTVITDHSKYLPENKDFEKRIEVLEEEVKKIRYLEGKIGYLERRLNVLESDFVSFERRVEDIEKIFAGFQKEFADLKSYVLNLKEISSNVSKMERIYPTNLEERLSFLEDRISTLEKNILKLSTNVGFALNKIDELSNMGNKEIIVMQKEEKNVEKVETVMPNISIPDLNEYRRIAEQTLERFRRLVRSYEISRILGIEDGYVYITVRKGDTLAEISSAYSLGDNGVEILMRLNNIKDPRKLKVGSIIKVPVKNLEPVFPVASKPLPDLILSGFGRGSKGVVNTGIKIKNLSKNVYAVLPGRVIKLEKTSNGYVIEIDSGNEVICVYKGIIISAVREGQWVAKGEVIGYGDNHVTFELWVEGEPKDPMFLFFSSLGKFEITFYTEWEDGKLPEHPAFRVTRSGKIPRPWRTIAADPAIIPIGSIVYIPDFRDKPNGGIFVVEDIGAVIKGKKIDIYMDSVLEALHNKKFKTKVFILRSSVIEGG